VLAYLKLSMPATRLNESTPHGNPAESKLCTATKGIPQDIRISPDGKLFYVADMLADGVHIVDGASFTKTEFVQTGVASRGRYPSRDG
jgi:DNA-binding beta-propeller fold protein YncE